ncbi:putative membrane protein YobI [Paraliobacillus quinghaiensis]|uniref:Membrane protein YobI n=1 Tax=Paraliobacillus quinghaiensis TaxID=470815 RepID=A0A917TRT3_9BACI|nr:putative membrane protein YobI [Paraliobacillus quinghaiensis]
MLVSWKDRWKRWFVRSLERIVGKLKDPPVTPLYEDLTPNDDIDNDGIYAGAIRSGLENEKVKNIAITGPYGSGKSSILRTFEKNHNQTYHFLNISLATFGSKPNTPSGNNEGGGGQEDERALEKSILQQMIYRVRDRTIPFSRFRKIKHMKSRQTIQQLFLFLAFIAGVIYFFVPNLFGTLYENTVLNQSEETMSLIGAILLLVFISVYGFFLLKQMYRFLRGNLNFNKVTIANASLEMDKTKDDNSIFDRFIDEILYFFQATKYDVVLFEDLDRFDSLDIFERLRELNALINNSELVKRRVVFIYAIKDDIFGQIDTVEHSRSRTKFFDFIIPVIPILHAYNSVEVLRDRLIESPYIDEIDPNFLQDVSLYVDDMRILKNIYTEFDIYKKKLGGDLELDTNKLLGLIIYKNLYPVDFSQLQYNQGLVYQMMKQKDAIIEQQLTMLDDRIKQMEQKIELAKAEQLVSIDELQQIYLQSLNARTGNYNKFIRLNNTNFGNNTTITASFFKQLKNAQNVSYNMGNGNKTATIDEIATVFGSKDNYFERETSIKLKKEENLEAFKQQISQLKRERTEVHDLSLKELIAKSDKRVFPEELLDKDLLVYLLRHGYIDDTYHYYISYFYPGSLTKRDMDFILSVKNYKGRDFSYSLLHVEKVISRLRISEFKQAEILNYDLLDFILEKDQYQEHFKLILSQLTNEKDTSLQFVTGFKERTAHKQSFIKSLCHNWDNIWVYIEEASNLSDEEIQVFLADILLFADVADLEELNKEDKLAAYLAELDDYFKVSEDLPSVKEQDILSRLRVKFTNTTHLRPKGELFTYVVEKNLYQINKQTLSDILQGKVSNLTYSAIEDANVEKVLAYIDQNINVFVREVLLDQEISQETEEAIIELLNRNYLYRSLKELIIEQQALLIQDITEVDQELWNVLLEKDKLIISWHNVFQYFKVGQVFDETMIDYLNDIYHARELAKYRLADEEAMEEDERHMLSEEIMKCQEIENASFEKLAASITKWDFYYTDDLPEARVRIMIENDILSLTVKNYENIKANHPSLHLFLIEENIAKFVNHQDDYVLNLEEIETLFHSDVPDIYKTKLMKQIDPAILSESEKAIDFAEEVVEFIVHQGMEAGAALIDVLFSFDMAKRCKVMLLTSQVKTLEQEKITELLQALGTPYAGITKGGKRPAIANNDLNQALLSELDRKDYISQFKLEKKRLRVFTYTR